MQIPQGEIYTFTTLYSKNTSQHFLLTLCVFKIVIWRATKCQANILAAPNQTCRYKPVEKHYILNRFTPIWVNIERCERFKEYNRFVCNLFFTY